MPLVYTADELIEEVRNRASLPDIESHGTADADILRFLNAELRNEIIPEVMKLREEYLAVRIVETVTSGRVRIPERAIGQKLRDVYWLDGEERIDMPRLTPEDVHWVRGNGASTRPYGFYMEGNHLVLVPAADYQGAMEISFYFRPGELVKEESARKISAVNWTTRTITLESAIPPSWTTANRFDVHGYWSGAEIKVWGVSASSLVSTTLVATSAIDGSVPGTNGVEPGDWLCLAGEAAIPGIPLEMHTVLAQSAAARILESIGDLEQLQATQGILNRMQEQKNYLLDDRVEGATQKITGRDSILWKGRARGRMT